MISYQDYKLEVSLSLQKCYKVKWAFACIENKLVSYLISYTNQVKIGCDLVVKIKSIKFLGEHKNKLHDTV